MPATLFQFATVNDACAATTKKLVKQRLLADYFRTLADDADLRLAVRYCAGRDFPATDERTTNVGGAIFSDVATDVLKMDGATWHDLVVRSGEIGEALSRARTARGTSESPAAPPRDTVGPLTLAELSESFDALASTGDRERKKQILRDLIALAVHPREAAYLGKVLFGDLRTGVQEGVLQAAVAQAFGRTLQQIQRCQLLVGDLDEVAVLARHDRLDAAAFALFHPIQFMLATPQETGAAAAGTMAGRQFWAEDKLDGIRAQVHKQGDRLAMYTRTMDRADESFPDVVQALLKLPGDFLLDGEIVPYQDGVVLPFARIQKRLGRKAPTAKVLRDNPCAFVAFDLLYRDGTLLMDEPLAVRRASLEELAGLPAGARLVSPSSPDHGATPVSPLQGQVAESGAVDAVVSPAAQKLLVTRYTPVTTAEEIDAAFACARDCRNEGLVLKDPQAPYSPGRRGQMWLKLKTHLPTIDCVVTAAEYGHGKRRDSLSDYTFAIWDREPAEEGATLVNVGKAFSGVTDEEIATLTKLFLGIARGRYGRVFAVEPQVVLEIACDQIQKSGRHASGFALRFPRIKRIRWDKRPADADRLARVREIYEGTTNFAKGQAVEQEPKPEPTLFDGSA